MTPLQPSAAVQDTFVKRIQAQQQELELANEQIRRLQIALEEKERENQQLQQEKEKIPEPDPDAPPVSLARDDPTKSKIGTRACRRTTAPQPNSKLPQ